MQTKEEIKKIMFEYSDRLLNSTGDYVQCVVEDDWDNVADEILTLLQSNDAGQPNGSKPLVSRSVYVVQYSSVGEDYEVKILGKDVNDALKNFHKTYHSVDAVHSITAAE